MFVHVGMASGKDFRTLGARIRVAVGSSWWQLVAVGLFNQAGQGWQGMEPTTPIRATL